MLKREDVKLAAGRFEAQARGRGFTLPARWYGRGGWLLEGGTIDRRNPTIRNHGQKFTLRLLQTLAEHETITLLCHCGEDQPHCHRHLLKKALAHRGGGRLRNKVGEKGGAFSPQPSGSHPAQA